MLRMSSMTRPKVCTNLLTSAKSQFSTSSVSLRSHYDTLGITPKATQNDIKSAYYKLTKVYHPDRNKTEEAKLKFRNITDAYEILGNYKSRRMYDRGMRPGPRPVDERSPEEVKKEDAQTRFYKSRLYRSQVPAPGGRTPIYNFDEWARAHYGELFDQRMKAKEAIQRNERFREADDISRENARLLVPILLVFFAMSAMILSTNVHGDYDTNKLISDKKEPKSS